MISSRESLQNNVTFKERS
uniref:Uncharacterized protein n=1 Tax=Rhizophora mucronata TaxID=61149 RepID=A0A2P2QU09_RHIMU